MAKHRSSVQQLRDLAEEMAPTRPDWARRAHRIAGGWGRKKLRRIEGATPHTHYLTNIWIEICESADRDAAIARIIQRERGQLTEQQIQRLWDLDGHREVRLLLKRKGYDTAARKKLRPQGHSKKVSHHKPSNNEVSHV